MARSAVAVDAASPTCETAAAPPPPPHTAPVPWSASPAKGPAVSRPTPSSSRRPPLPITLLTAIVLAIGCGGAPDPGDDSARTTAPASFDVASIASAHVEGVADSAIVLDAGVWRSAPLVEGSPVRETVEWIDELVHVGDLDGDGAEEALAYFSDNSGGTGHFLYLGWMEAGGGDGSAPARTVAVRRLGDRVQIRDAELVDGVLRMSLVVAGPGDGACCPTHLEERRFTFADGTIREERESRGTIGYDDLVGTRWVLEALDWRPGGADAATDAGVDLDAAEVTLSFTEDGVTGRAGCNRFTGPVIVGEAKELTLGNLATTKMACPPPVDALERTVLARLAGVNGWSFMMGRLLLGYVHDDRYGALVFRRAE